MTRPIAFHRFAAGYGLTLTPAQRVLASVCFDRVEPADLRGDEREIARQLFGPIETIPPIVRPVIALKKGARVGGTLMCSMQLYRLGNLVPLDALALGEQAYGVIVAPDMRLGRQALSYVVGCAKHDAHAGKITIVRESADAITWERADGCAVTIEVLPATAGGGAVRARTLFGALMTEASFMRDTDYKINDADVFKGLTPRLTLPGSMAMIESTAWAALGLLHTLIVSNHGAPTSALAVVAPTLLMRPEMSDHVERAMALDEATARREFFCVESATDSEIFFDAVEACLDSRLPLVVEAPENAIKSCGVDLGLVQNSTAAVVGATHAGVFIPLEVLELRPSEGAPLKLSYVVHEIAKLLRRHGLTMCTADHHLIDAAREWAAPLGIIIRAAKGGAEAKAENHIALRTAMREARVKISAGHTRLVAQLRSIRARPLAGGGMRIDAPTSGNAHGDIASAFVLAHAGANGGAAKWRHAVARWNALGGAEGMAQRLGLEPSIGKPWK